ncbi:hypothetical protein DF047_32550 [Burkholderia cenocepacia]|nr:hypothetical protein DF047_32550 [Burkholderia cenocepacia]
MVFDRFGTTIHLGSAFASRSLLAGVRFLAVSLQEGGHRDADVVAIAVVIVDQSSACEVVG